MGDDAWRTSAACRGKPTEWWFPGQGEWYRPLTERARQICADCPVADPCRDYAIGNVIDHGIWGGTHPGRRTDTQTATTTRTRVRQRSAEADAILDLLADGHWHTYTECATVAGPHIDDTQAGRRLRQLARWRGRDIVNVSAIGLRHGRHLVTIDRINALHCAGLVERGNGAVRRIDRRGATT